MACGRRGGNDVLDVLKHVGRAEYGDGEADRMVAVYVHLRLKRVIHARRSRFSSVSTMSDRSKSLSF